MSFESKFLEKTILYATRILKEELSDKLHYHNFEHTRFVAEQAEKIGEYVKLTDDEMEMVLIASWLHDLGYIHKSEGHEEESIRMADQFLHSIEYPVQNIEQVKRAIEATKIPQKPLNLICEVLCDADLAHLAVDDFFERCNSLRAEWLISQNRILTDYEWFEVNQNFMSEHRFFTQYGKEVMEEQKKDNLKRVQKRLKKAKKAQNNKLAENLRISSDKLKNLEKKLKKVDGRSERGVETVFRITSRNHLNLSSMADSKANIMISVNTIIISVVISILLHELENRPNLILPTACLLISCLTTIIFAVLATRPNVTSGRFKREDVEGRQTNLLFFWQFS